MSAITTAVVALAAANVGTNAVVILRRVRRRDAWVVGGHELERRPFTELTVPQQIIDPHGRAPHVERAAWPASRRAGWVLRQLAKPAWAPTPIPDDFGIDATILPSRRC